MTSQVSPFVLQWQKREVMTMVLHCTAQRTGKLLSFLRRELHMSSGLVSRLKFLNSFFVDGEPAHTDRKIRPGQEISVVIEESRPTEFVAEHTPITIAYEDEAILAVDKPAGVIVHPTFHRTEGTLLTQVLGYYERTGQNCGIHTVNRLDRDTMGIVLFAKNSHVHGLCYENQLAGKFQKTYLALCLGAPDPREGSIDLPIGRVDGGSLLRKIDPAGQPALTTYRTLAVKDGKSLVELSPITGRTHQLRLHCLAMGFPILGDPQYFTEESRSMGEKLGFSTQQLLAKSLTLPHPLTGESVTIVSGQELEW